MRNLVLMSIVAAMVSGAYVFWTYLGGSSQPISFQGVTDSNTIRYVALGDSYTVGEGVAARDAWPSQVVKITEANGVKMQLVSTIARSGWTTNDLIGIGFPIFDSTSADFVTVMIGTNDAVQGLSPEQFQTNIRIILDKVAQLVPPEKTVVVTVPDFAITPTGAQKATTENPEQQIRSFNSILQNECAERGIAVVDLYDISRNLAADPRLLSKDGFHPSAAGHAQWAGAIAPVVLQVLGK